MFGAGGVAAWSVCESLTAWSLTLVLVKYVWAVEMSEGARGGAEPIYAEALRKVREEGVARREAEAAARREAEEAARRKGAERAGPLNGTFSSTMFDNITTRTGRNISPETPIERLPPPPIFAKATFVPPGERPKGGYRKRRKSRNSKKSRRRRSLRR